MKKYTFIALSWLLLAGNSFFANAQAPTVPAPEPSQEESVNVVAIFSDYYEDTIELNCVDWGGKDGNITAEITEISEGDEAIYLHTLGWCPIQMKRTINLTDMAYLHLDVYFTGNNGNGSFSLGLQSWNPNPNREIYPYTNATIPAGEWMSLDIPIEIYTAQGMGLTHPIVLRFRGSGEFYVDNIYAHDGEHTSANDYTGEELPLGDPCDPRDDGRYEPAYMYSDYPSPPVPEYPEEDVWPVFTNRYATKNIIQLSHWNSDMISEFVQVGEENACALYLAKSTWEVYGIDSKISNLSEYDYLHYDYLWIDQGSGSFGIGLIQLEPRVTVNPQLWIEPENRVQGQWQSVDVPVSLYLNNGFAGCTVNFLRWEGSGQFFLTNIYCYKGEPVTPPAPPTPDAIANQNEDQKGIFYPAIITDELVISSEKEIDSVILYTLDGKIVLTEKDNTLNTSSLASGIYLVAVRMGSGENLTGKIVKQ